MSVLITRPQPDADAFAELCRARKVAPIVCPIMEIEALEGDISLVGVSALAFTSANGVRVFANSNPARHLPVFTVGEGSAGAARAAGFENICAAGGDVDALVQLIVDYKSSLDGELLHIAGTNRAGDLVSDLMSGGVSARRKVLYTVRDAIALPLEIISALTTQPPIDWVVLFSPRSAALFLTLINHAGVTDELAHLRAACLSQAVAEKISKSCWKSVEIAASRNVAAMIELVASA